MSMNHDFFRLPVTLEGFIHFLQFILHYEFKSGRVQKLNKHPSSAVFSGGFWGLVWGGGGYRYDWIKGPRGVQISWAWFMGGHYQLGGLGERCVIFLHLNYVL